MTKSPLLSAASLAICLLATACSEELPKCADESTLDLVRQIMFERVNIKNLGENEMRTLIKFEYPRATGFDEKIKKYSCDAKLIAGDSIQLPITYESQIDDKNQHLVGLEGISTMDRYAVERAIKNKLQPLAAGKSKSDTPAPASHPPITGLWRGQLDGDREMQVTAKDGGFEIELSVSNESCAGSIEGLAQLTGNTLTLHKRDDDATCTIKAVFSGKTATLTANECTLYHGLACGFAGKLEKVE